MLRIVLDTNVFIDALFNGSKTCRSILKLESQNECETVMSEEILEELIATLKALILTRGLSADESITILKPVMRLLRRTISIETISTVSLSVDDSDNRFIECAIDGNAVMVLTSDAHLNNIKEKIVNNRGQTIKFITPKNFLQYIKQEASNQ